MISQCGVMVYVLTGSYSGEIGGPGSKTLIFHDSTWILYLPRLPLLKMVTSCHLGPIFDDRLNEKILKP